ncbi:MAG: hypothetical protein JWL83_98 [Actinomycetia bacterium]|nr:hypothetical protein [Actinomycetes bacterium]
MKHARHFISFLVCALLGCIGVLPSTASAATRAATTSRHSAGVAHASATTHTAATTTQGYWLDATDGGIFNYGSATFHGSTGAMALNKPVVGMAATPSGNGYWLVATDGGIFAFGDAHFRGSTGAMALNKPIVGMAATPSGNGYWLVASDGGIFAFGDAHFHGSTGAMTLNKPIVGMASTPSGNGYWLVATDGGIFNYGDAHFHGSTGAMALNKPIAGMASTPTGAGYWLVATDGGIFNYGDATFHGSTGAIALNKPIVGMAAISVGSTPLEATKLGFTTQPGNSTGGIAFARQPRVTVQNASSGAMSDATTHVTLAIATGGSGGLSCTGGLTKTATNGVAAFAGCKINTAGPYTLSATATATTLTSATSNSITIGVGAAASLMFSAQPGGAINNSSFVHEPTVTALDAGGNIVTDFTGPVTLGITGGGAVLGCVSNTVSAIAGVATFTGCDIDTIGNFTLTATAPGDVASPPSATVPVTGPATHLAFGTPAPSSTGTGGSVLAAQPVILVKDALGTTVNADSSTVTLALASGPGGGVLACTGGLTKAAVEGVATFAGCNFDMASVTPYTFTATDGALVDVTSGNITIGVGTAAKLFFNVSPSASTVAGIAFGVQAEVWVEDAGNNIVTTDSTTVVSLSIASGGAGVLTCTPVTAAAGIATFSGCMLNIVGTYTLTAGTDSELPTPVASGNVAITAGTPAQLAFSAQPSATAISSVAFASQPVVTVQDAFGNTALTDVSNVTLVPSAATLGCTANTVAAIAGVATFTGCDINLAGSYTLTASDGALTPAVSSPNTVVTSAGAAQLAFTPGPGGTTGGTPFSVDPQVTVQDAAGNTVTSDDTTLVTLTKTTGPGTLTCDPATAVAGIATFTGCSLDTIGTYTLTATAPGGLTSPPSGNVVITVGTATTLVLTGAPGGGTGGVAFGTQPVATYKDAGGNTATNTDTVTFTKVTGPSGGVLSGCSIAAVAGVATFTACKIDLIGTYTLHASDGDLTTATSGNVVITRGVAASTLITTQAGGTLTGGTAFGIQPVVKIRDAGGNTVIADNSSTVTLSKATGPGTLTCTPVVAVAGVATFVGCKFDTIGTYTLTASDGTHVSPAGSPIVITLSGATSLAFTPSPSGATGGIAFTTQPMVTIRDAGGNTLTTNSTSSIALAITTGSDGVLSTCPAVVASAGVATFSGCKIDVNGTYKLTATGAGLTSPESSNVVVGVGVAASIAVTTPGGSLTGGTPFGVQPVATIKDAGGNTRTSDSVSTVHLAKFSGPGTLTCADPTAVAGVATFTGCKFDTTGTYKVTATGAGFTSSPSGDVVITAGGAASLALTVSPGGGTGGTALGTQPIVTAKDAGGNTAPSYTNTVAFTKVSGPGGGTVSTCSVAAVAGVATFTACTIDTAGTYTLHATDLDLTSATTGNVVITVGAATTLALTVQPGGSTGGVAFGTQPVVTSKDAGGNTVSNTNTVTFTKVTGPGALSGCSIAAVGGVATFTACTLDTVGTYTLHASDGTLTSATTGNVVITVGAAATLALTVQPGGSTGGVAFGTQPVVTSKDAGGNTTTSTLTITFTKVTGPGTLSTCSVAAVSGVATFTACKIDTIGTYTLHASDGTLTSATTGNVVITAGATATLALTVQPGGGTGGTALGTQPVVTAKDAGGNTATASTSTVSFTKVTGPGGGSVSTCSVAEVAGVATFTACKINIIGTYTLNASDGTFTSATTGNVVITLGSAAKLAFTTAPVGAAAAANFGTQPVVTVQDAGGNTSTTDGSDVTLSITGGAGVLSCTSAGNLTGTAANGVVTFAGCKISLAGSYTVTATDSIGGVTTTTAPVTIT